MDGRVRAAAESGLVAVFEPDARSVFRQPRRLGKAGPFPRERIAARGCKPIRTGRVR